MFAVLKAYQQTVWHCSFVFSSTREKSDEKVIDLRLGENCVQSSNGNVVLLKNFKMTSPKSTAELLQSGISPQAKNKTTRNPQPHFKVKSTTTSSCSHAAEKCFELERNGAVSHHTIVI